VSRHPTQWHEPEEYRPLWRDPRITRGVATMSEDTTRLQVAGERLDRVQEVLDEVRRVLAAAEKAQAAAERARAGLRKVNLVVLISAVIVGVTKTKLRPSLAEPAPGSSFSSLDRTSGPCSMLTVRSWGRSLPC
jgi:hypothetical protein